MPDNPTDFVNLSDWLGVNAEAGQQMDQALAGDVNAHADASRSALGQASQNALRGMSYGGSRELTSYGDYVTAQREASEAQAKSTQYSTLAGRQAGLSEKYGTASAYDAALTGAAAAPNVSGLDSEMAAHRKNFAQAGGEYHDWLERQRQMQERMFAQYRQQAADREARGAEAKKRKDMIDLYRPIIQRNYDYHNWQGRGEQGTDPSGWSEQQWYEEAKRMSDDEDSRSTTGPAAGNGEP